MEQRTSLTEIIEYIDPGSLDYQDWVNVGMALKLEGYPVSVWDQWSRKDFGRYHAGECEKKWRSFSGSTSPVTGGTVVQMAMERGWVPEKGHELDWNDSIQVDSDRVVVDKNWLEGREIQEPKNWNPAEQLITYLETLFEAGENVGYVTGSWEKTDEKGTRWLPQKGSWDRTAGQLIEQLNTCKGDIGAVLGDYNPEAGAWIRFNPLDGNGCKNENVTEYRYALVESDHMEIDQQNAILRELELPIACLVYSGKKSLHAIVRVDAADYGEYRKRVDYLYEVCQKNGIDVDTQNRNPSRLSRMPGVERGEKKQFIVDTNIGKSSWNEWYEWIEGVNDDLPEPEGLESVWDNLPELSPCLIDGVLRKGHDFLKTGGNQAEFDRRVQKAVNTAVTKAQEKWQALADDKLSEAEKLAKMTKEEKAQYMQQKREKELTDREAAITRKELMAEAKNTLASDGLPQELAEVLDYSDADTCKKSMEKVKEVFQRAVETAVEEKLKGGKPPKKAPGGDAQKALEEQVYNIMMGNN